MPGSGKSTIGKAVARRLDLPFVDCDISIEQRVGCSIAAFFERQGEDAFRDLEMETMASLVQGGPSVVATGGGIVLRERGAQPLRVQRADGVVADDDGAASPRQSLEAGRRIEQARPDLDRVAPVAELHADDRSGVHGRCPPAPLRRCTTSSTRRWNERPSVSTTNSAVSR